MIILPKYQDDLPKKRFEFIVQGMKVGEYEIPSQLFTYFDIERNTYITLHTSPLSVSIMPGMFSTKKDITDTSIADAIAQGDELADINAVGIWYPVAERKPLPWWLFELLFLLPCLYVLYPIIQERFIIFTGSSARLARRRALKYARQKIQECIKTNNDAELHAIFMQLLKHYSEEVIDNHSIRKLLKQSKLSPELIEQWHDFFERITHAAYAQSDKKNSDELCGMAKQWLDRLEKNI
jgi:hypothetical protein